MNQQPAGPFLQNYTTHFQVNEIVMLLQPRQMSEHVTVGNELC
jgi:hypothetical protein